MDDTNHIGKEITKYSYFIHLLILKTVLLAVAVTNFKHLINQKIAVLNSSVEVETLVLHAILSQKRVKIGKRRIYVERNLALATPSLTNLNRDGRKHISEKVERASRKSILQDLADKFQYHYDI